MLPTRLLSNQQIQGEKEVRSLFRIIFCLALLPSGLPSAALAEPADNSPKHFYKQDFAKQPGEESGDNSQKLDNLEQTPKDEKASSQTEQPVTSSNPELSGVKVLALGIAVGGDGSEKSHENLLALKELAIRFELPVSEVLVVGGIGLENDQPILAALGVMGGQIKIVETADEEYPVKQSPTWIVETAQGKILLEGIDSIDKFFNSRGEFVERAEGADLQVR